MNKIVSNCYIAYRLLYCKDHTAMPPIMSNITSNIQSGVMAYVDFDDLSKPVVPVNIKPTLFEQDGRYIEAMLFHEFTHILDSRELMHKFPPDKANALMKTYSEFHASQVELNTIIPANDRENIDINTYIITTDIGRETVINNCLGQMSSAISIISKPRDEYTSLSAEEYYKKYLTFETRTMYYLGKKSVCESLSAKFPTALLKGYGAFAPYVSCMDNACRAKDYNKILFFKDCICKLYKETFPCGEAQRLPESIMPFELFALGYL